MANKGKAITYSQVYPSDPCVKCGYGYRHISNHACPQCVRASQVQIHSDSVTSLDVDRRRLDIEEAKIEKGYTLDDLM